MSVKVMATRSDGRLGAWSLIDVQGGRLVRAYLALGASKCGATRRRG